jgi:hypothetical protein
VRLINETMVLALVAIVVLLSRRREAIAVIVLGLAAILASASPGLGWPPAAASVLRSGGDILIFSSLTWVVGACGLRAWPRYVAPASRCGCAVSEPRDDLCLSLRPNLRAELRRLRRSPCSHAWPRRKRHDDVFQPDDLDHDRLR